jgi:hypothetical protein
MTLKAACFCSDGKVFFAIKSVKQRASYAFPPNDFTFRMLVTLKPVQPFFSADRTHFGDRRAHDFYSQGKLR